VSLHFEAFRTASPLTKAVGDPSQTTPRGRRSFIPFGVLLLLRLHGTWKAWNRVFVDDFSLELTSISNEKKSRLNEFIIDILYGYNSDHARVYMETTETGRFPPAYLLDGEGCNVACPPEWLLIGPGENAHTLPPLARLIPFRFFRAGESGAEFLEVRGGGGRSTVEPP